jgi:hypothetical protein
MKKKDINTFINDKLEQESGIPYKEEYWDSMNELLNANLPVSKSPFQAVKSSFKGLSKGFKFLYIAAGSSIIIVAAVLFITSKSEKDTHKLASVQTEINANNVDTKNSLPTQNENKEQNISLENNLSSEPSIDVKKEELNNELITTQNPTLNIVLPDKVSSSNSLNRVLQKKVSNSNSLNGDKNIETSNNPNFVANANAQSSVVASSITHSAEHKNSNNNDAAEIDRVARESNDLNVANHSVDEVDVAILQTTQNANKNDLVRTKPFEFIELNKLDISKPIELTPNAISEVNVLPRKRMSLPFNLLNITAFGGVIREQNSTSLNKGNTSYHYPNILHSTYGLHVELGLKKFVLKTGIGWSKYAIEANTERILNNYKVDTSYVILDPNYGTTPSGKPYALIQRQIDSTIISTQTEVSTQKLSYQFLCVPLALQYQLPYKRFTFLLEGGTLHHFMLGSTKEFTLSPVSSENKLSIPAYQMQLTAGFGLRYAISQYWAVGCQYNFAKSIKQNSLNVPSDAHVGVITLTRIIW